MGAHPIVDERIPRAAIARIQQFPINQRDVANAADIENRNGFLEPTGANHGPVIGRREGCTLATMAHVVLTEIVYDGPAESVGHSLAVAQLPRPARLRLMSDRLAVKTDYVDRAQVDIPAGTEGEHRLRLQVGDLPFDACDVRTTGWQPQQLAAQLSWVTYARVGPNSQASTSVGLEN